MWKCPKCREEVDRTWDVCWRCGTGRNGREDPDYRPEVDAADGAETANAADTNHGSQYTLRALFVSVSLIAIVCAVTRGRADLMLGTLFCVLVANAAGAILAAFVTCGLRIPNDGSLTWDGDPKDDASAVSNHGKTG